MSNMSVSLSPHVRSENTTQKIMRNVIFALLPTTIFGIVWFGWGALLTVALSCVSALLSEFLMVKALKRPFTLNDGSALVTGLLLGLTLPAGCPWYVPVLGSVFAICIAKQVFGGLGDNFVNPALAGRAFLLASFPVAMTSFPTSRFMVDAVSTATPLSSEFAGTLTKMDAFLGLMSGSIGEVCKVALLLGGIYLVIRQIIDWRIPVAYLGTLVVLTAVTGGDPLDAVLLGGTMLGAIFMATDYVTSPVSTWGRVVFGVGIGIINFAIRKFGAYPEGVTYAILLMNIASPLIERFTRPHKYGEVKKNA